MRGDPRDRTFPLGFYAVLLLGLVGLTFPKIVGPIENAARTVVALPLRAYSIWYGSSDASAASSTPAAARVLPEEAQTILRGSVGPPRHTPRVCRVLSRNVGPLGVVDELVLDRPFAELAGCAGLVTSADGLLGFLHRPSEEDEMGKPARVRLLSYQRRGTRRARDRRPLRIREREPVARVAAFVASQRKDAEGILRFLVEPARKIDSWPLRCTLLDDSYLGSKLHESGAEVRTTGGADSSLPRGLLLGHLMIWGYAELSIPVGLFVAPVRDPRGISSVVVWEPGDGGSTPPGPALAAEFLAVRFARFPAPRPALERWMVTAQAGVTLPDGAALVDGDRLLGMLQRPWSGQSLVTPFAASTRTWALLLKTSKGDVQEIVARVLGRAEDGRVRLEVLAPESGLRRDGELWTGANGLHCPAGLRLGRAVPVRGVREKPANSGPRALAWNPGRWELLVSWEARDVTAPAVCLGMRATR